MGSWDTQSIDLKVCLSKNEVLEMLLGMDSRESSGIIIEAACRDEGLMQILTEFVMDRNRQ